MATSNKMASAYLLFSATQITVENILIKVVKVAAMLIFTFL